MNLLREYIRELISEGIEFRELKSPLAYQRGGNVKRLALCDASVTEPPNKGDRYFAEWEDWRKFSKTGRRLKKPVLDEIIPGVSDVCIVGFLDFHSQGASNDGKTMWYIDYMKTRDDHGGQGVASRLVDEFFNRYASTASHVHFGKMMNPKIGHLMRKKKEEYPGVIVIGARNY